jgi:pimeloyl-ACP methyl ester carboxylesterase
MSLSWRDIRRNEETNVVHAFVHGNPETEAVWWPLVDELRARDVNDIVLLSPPGFGAPVPRGWDGTHGSYRDWLTSELERLGGNVHLVGHDWGAGHVFGIVAHRPDLIASWAADCAGLLHPDYVWHDAAQVWQTPNAGEAAVTTMVNATPEEKLNLLTQLGITTTSAAHIAAAMNDAMAACILSLYRSAVQPALRELGVAAAAADRRPGMVIVATEDHYTGTPAMAHDSARRLQADTVVFQGANHWWMQQRPAEAARALAEFWNGH